MKKIVTAFFVLSAISCAAPTAPSPPQVPTVVTQIKNPTVPPVTPPVIPPQVTTTTMCAFDGCPENHTTVTPNIILNVTQVGTAGTASLFMVSAQSGAIWNWTFGDGEMLQTPFYAVTHAYAAAGTYPLSVSPTVLPSLVARAQVVVAAPLTVIVQPPSLHVAIVCTAAAHGSTTVCNVGTSYGSSTVASNLIATSYDWGDGIVTGGGTPLGSHAYAQAGTYTVVVTVSASTTDGGKTALASAQVVVG